MLQCNESIYNVMKKYYNVTELNNNVIIIIKYYKMIGYD